MTIRDKNISETTLNTRTKILLLKVGITNVNELLSTNIGYLMRIRGFGKSSYLDIKTFLEKNNINFDF